MSKSTRSRTSIFAYLLLIFVPLTLIAYLLRGFGILTFIPGGVILVFIALSLLTGIIYGVEKTKRF